MRYLIILLFLSGCGTTHEVQNLWSKWSAPVIVVEQDISYDELTETQHRLRAKKLGIAYVDYLHLINTNKKSVNKSYIKLRHNNE